VQKIFFGRDGRLRNGWWMAIFIVLFLASRVVYPPLSHGLQRACVPGDALEPLHFVFALLVTWVCVRLRKQTLASVGFAPGRRWIAESGIGLVLGAGTAVIAAMLICMAGGARLELDPSRSAASLAAGAYLFLFAALFEETLFRGFVFQRLVAGIGAPSALLLMSLLFASVHWDNPGLDTTTWALATVELFLGALLLGLAYLRTRSLAMPVGIHFGWNWALGSVLGFDVSGFGQSGWFHPVLLERPAWVSGGAFGPEASAFAVAVDAALVFALWRWRGMPAVADSPSG
jgi:membrane protease YdiL (CAAX protease family)